MMLENIVREIFENPMETVNKLIDVVSESIGGNTVTEEQERRMNWLENEINKAEARRTSIELKWLDGKLSDIDKERLCNTITDNVEKYNVELSGIRELVEHKSSVSEEIAEKLDHISRIEAALVSESNRNALNIDDEFVKSFLTRIVPYDGKCFKFYLNIGPGKPFFSEKDYDLYDYWTVSFEQARRYRQDRNQYLRRNQWEDLRVEVYVRTK